MINLEYIRSLNEEQLFEFLYSINLDQCECPARSLCGNYNNCEEAFKVWLQKEHAD